MIERIVAITLFCFGLYYVSVYMYFVQLCVCVLSFICVNMIQNILYTATTCDRWWLTLKTAWSFSPSPGAVFPVFLCEM